MKPSLFMCRKQNTFRLYHIPAFHQSPARSAALFHIKDSFIRPDISAKPGIENCLTLVESTVVWSSPRGVCKTHVGQGVLQTQGKLGISDVVEATTQQIFQLAAKDEFILGRGKRDVVVFGERLSVKSTVGFDTELRTMQCSPYDKEEVCVLDTEQRLHSVGFKDAPVQFPAQRFRYSSDPACFLGYGSSSFLLYDRRAASVTTTIKVKGVLDCLQDCGYRVSVLTPTHLKLFDLRFPDEGEYMQLPHLSETSAPNTLVSYENSILAFHPSAHAQVLRFNLPQQLQNEEIEPEAFPLAILKGRSGASQETSLPHVLESAANHSSEAIIQGISLLKHPEALLHSDNCGCLYTSLLQNSGSGTHYQDFFLEDLQDNVHWDRGESAAMEFTSAHGLLKHFLS